MYGIYSSEHSGQSLNFGFSRDDAYSREVVYFKGALIIYIKKTSKYFQLVTLQSNNENSDNNKSVQNTTIYKRKIALQAKLAVLQNFLLVPIILRATAVYHILLYNFQACKFKTNMVAKHFRNACSSWCSTHLKKTIIFYRKYREKQGKNSKN